MLSRYLSQCFWKDGLLSLPDFLSIILKEHEYCAFFRLGNIIQNKLYISPGLYKINKLLAWKYLYIHYHCRQLSQASRKHLFHIFTIMSITGKKTMPTFGQYEVIGV